MVFPKQNPRAIGGFVLLKNRKSHTAEGEGWGELEGNVIISENGAEYFKSFDQ